MAGTFILLAQALLQASALIGLQKAFILQFMVGTTNGVNAVGVLPHTRIRISYTFQRKQCMCEIMFPSHDPTLLYLEGM